ncbi:DNA-binding protein [Donghicola sp. XS_ASV15]|uniref:DNA-binding protein n=1 Tax=Donghicola sp. XS_ASV15 TaxID=3241295 RepID=UPI0035154FAA
MTIEIEDVFEAAQALQEDGTEASTRNVQAKLGSKAHSYIPAFTGLWNRRNAHLAEVSELPDAFLEEAKLLALGLWKTANDRADIREELHLREIERLRSQMAERERMWSKEREEMEKRINEAYADISCLTDEVCELKEQLHAAQEQVVEAEKAKEDAEDRRDKAEARFTTYSGIVQSGNELDKAQLEGLWHVPHSLNSRLRG